jgi:hypothetical protein
MSFEILCIPGETRRLRPAEFRSETGRSGEGFDFVDQDGCPYSGFFDGRNVIFSDGAADYAGNWRQGTTATVIRRTRLLPVGFTFIFMDHGHIPQRLHALWEFDGPQEAAVEAWKLAGFSVSSADRYFNRNHSRSSIHFRTKGARITGADSSHAIMTSGADGNRASGEIHVGEFNPFTGLGVGFVLHQMEGRSSFARREALG